MDEEMDNGSNLANETSGNIKSFASGVKNVASNIGKTFNKIGKIVVRIFRFLGQFFTWLLGALSALVPILLPVIIVVVVLIVLASVFSGGYDPNTQTMTSIGGINGTQFYGERVLYYDDEYTSNNLIDEYKEFTYNILQEVNETYTINIDFSNPYLTSPQIESIVLNFTESLTGNTNQNLLTHASQIDHYGFTNSESEQVLNSISNYLILNGYSTATQATLLLKLQESYTQHFSYMKNVCKKIIIKDYLLEENKTVSDIPKKNYAGFIYMPRKNVIIESSYFIFAVDETKTVDITANFTNGTDIIEIKTATADSTWMKNGTSDKTFEIASPNEQLLAEFTAFNAENKEELKNGKTLFDLLKNETFNNYFKDTNGDFSISTLLKNVKTANYMYLELASDSAFNFTEGYSTVKG